MDNLHILFRQYIKTKLLDMPIDPELDSDLDFYMEKGILPEREGSLELIQILLHDMFNDPEMTDYLVEINKADEPYSRPSLDDRKITPKERMEALAN